MGTTGHKGVSVAPSPLNRVKLELGVLLGATPLVWLVVEGAVTDPAWQLFFLGGYGLAALAWLVARTRRVVRNACNGESDGSKAQ